MNPANYSISYSPSARAGGRGFYVKLTNEFCSFARTQRVNKRVYESRAKLFILQSGLEKSARTICNWDGGLLTHVTVPGNACGLDLVLNQPNSPCLAPHNVDNLSQMSALLAISTMWLNDMEYRIEKN